MEYKIRNDLAADVEQTGSQSVRGKMWIYATPCRQTERYIFEQSHKLPYLYRQ